MTSDKFEPPKLEDHDLGDLTKAAIDYITRDIELFDEKKRELTFFFSKIVNIALVEELHGELIVYACGLMNKLRHQDLEKAINNTPFRLLTHMIFLAGNHMQIEFGEWEERVDGLAIGLDDFFGWTANFAEQHPVSDQLTVQEFIDMASELGFIATVVVTTSANVTNDAGVPLNYQSSNLGESFNDV